MRKVLVLVGVFSSSWSACSSGEHPPAHATGGALTKTDGGGAGTGGREPDRSEDPNGEGPDAPLSGCGLPKLITPLREGTRLLEVVNWAGKQAALSYTFDDGNSSQIQNYDALNALGVPFTFYLVTNWGGGSSEVWKRAVADGHELGNHTHSHAETGEGTDIDTANQQIQARFGVKPLTMAAPFGNLSYRELARSRFLFNRGVGSGSIAPLSAQDRYALPTHLPATNANRAALDEAVSSAISQGRWQTLTIHGFTGGQDGAYQPIPLDDFLAHVKGQRDSDKVWIDSLLNVGAYFVAQKLIEEARPLTSPEGSTWSWELPDHFPSGRCVRVRSTGRVFQDGRALELQENGTYEISLDRGQLSVRTD